MKYEIEIGESCRMASVEKTDSGYKVQIDDGKVMVFTCADKTPKNITLVTNAQSIDVRHAFCNDLQEVHIDGRRFVASVMDPRKKVLALASSAGGDVVASQMPGQLLSVAVQVGDAVSKGDVVATVVAMKMENPLKSPRDGIVAEICAQEGELLEAKGLVLRLEAQ